MCPMNGETAPPLVPPSWLPLYVVDWCVYLVVLVVVADVEVLQQWVVVGWRILVSQHMQQALP